ncbi:tripartite motif-containing protein 77 [Lepus europaeus]|uniref:tripartite motif-containing protein 77 n=1 Tax=Lepus europaeus TaxID=9983 RepID=UPI002B48999A|nr:tripartite motif-containing protein 77 [Lepus europaeus]
MEKAIKEAELGPKHHEHLETCSRAPRQVPGFAFHSETWMLVIHRSWDTTEKALYIRYLITKGHTFFATCKNLCSLNKLICSICTDYFTDPVTISCGHRFCSPCLCIFWEDVQTPVCCPVCQKISQKIDWQSIIFAEKQTAHTIICMIHKKVKDLICETDKKLLCVLCSESPEHATHRLCPIQQAAEYCREKLLMQMKSIWKKRQKNQRNLNKETNIIRTWQAFINLRMVMIKAEYPTLYQYLHEEKQRHLESLAIEGRMIFQQLKRSKARMDHMGQVLRGTYEELKGLCCAADVRLLQGLGNILKRSESVQLYMPQPVNPQLSSWAITGMPERLNFFRVYITLDHNNHSHHLLLMEDLRRLQCSPYSSDMSQLPASSHFSPSWAAQIFTSGKHYWEVDVGNSCNWVIGLCKESWTKRNDMRLESEGIFLLACVKVDDHFTLFSTSPLLQHYIQRPWGWVGVFLDYEFGIVSFVNVAQRSLICSFLSCDFHFPLRPFIFHGPK